MAELESQSKFSNLIIAEFSHKGRKWGIITLFDVHNVVVNFILALHLKCFWFPIYNKTSANNHKFKTYHSLSFDLFIVLLSFTITNNIIYTQKT
jgi:hypothetical protein